MRAVSSTLSRATASCAWWQVVRKPSFFASSSAAAIRSGRSPKNLKPSAPRRAESCTKARACSGVMIGSFTACPKVTYGLSRGAVIWLASLFFLCSTMNSSPLPLPGSALVVMPCAIQSFSTYSAGVPCSCPPRCPWRSTKPGST